MLTGKVAVVTGSSAGIGAAIAKELADRGATVIINFPFPSLKSEADAVLQTLSTPNCLAVEADLSTTTGPQHLIDTAISYFPKIDILVNNASIAINKPLEEVTLDDWDRMVNLNGRGYLLMTQAVLPHLNNPSRIVNIVSASARAAPPTQTVYAGTKGMQDGFTKVWAQELPRKYGCTVNAVSPGPTLTPAIEAAMKESPADQALFAATVERTPVGPRLGQSEEIAYAVGILCEDRAGWMNGNHIHVNGGLVIG